MPENINLSPWTRILACASLCLLASGASAVSPGELPAGHWYEVPDSNLDAQFPDPAPPGWTGPRSVMDAWSGGAYDTLRDRLIVWGGGHMDYAGNEIYAFDVNALVWTRITEPTPDNQIVTNAARYADGRPSSRHTYNYLQYSPDIDALVSLGFSAGYGDQSTGGGGNAVDAFNFGANRWEVKSTKPSNGITIGSITAHDPSTGKLWHHGCLSHEGGLVVYDPATNTWSGPYGEHYVEYYATAAIDPTRQIMVATGGSGNNSVLVWDLNNPGSPTEVKTSGDKALESAQAPGFVYDPIVDKFVGWSGGASVYTLDPDTWVWREVSPAPSNVVTPTPPNETGTYGRFRYIPSKNAFILVNRTDENAYFYKLSGRGGTPPPDPPPETPPDTGGEANDGNGGALDPLALLVMLAAFGWRALRVRV